MQQPILIYLEVSSLFVHEHQPHPDRPSEIDLVRAIEHVRPLHYNGKGRIINASTIYDKWERMLGIPTEVFRGRIYYWPKEGSTLLRAELQTWALSSQNTAADLQAIDNFFSGR